MILEVHFIRMVKKVNYFLHLIVNILNNIFNDFQSRIKNNANNTESSIHVSIDFGVPML
jgi:hypothetical protein